MHDSKSFDGALASARRRPDDAGTPDAPRGAFVNPLMSAAPPLDSDPPSDDGVAYLWDHAVAWVPEPEFPEPIEAAPREPPNPPPPPPSRAAPSADVETIARELNLTEASTPDELNRVRRRFMWENHPDRYPDIPEGLANRRVAIANMLVDRALENLLRPKRAK
jgi:hypothetical protein